MYIPYERRFRIAPLTSVRVDPHRRDFTDRLANAVSLSDAEAIEYLTTAVGDAPPVSDRLLRLFLHEVTHHASFAGNVGAALAALALCSSGQAGIPGRHPKGVLDLFLPARDAFILRWVETVYEPIVEGAALFAEYDLSWGEYDNTCHALYHGVHLFLMKEVRASMETAFREGSSDIAAAMKASKDALRTCVNTRLRDARMTEDALEQKMHLLSQPMIPPNGGHPYLLGYLATKRAYLVRRRFFEPLNDVDLFLLTYVGYWFSDGVLVENLLSLADANLVAVQYTIGAMGEHFQDRWSEFYAKAGSLTRTLNAALQAPTTESGATAALGGDELRFGVRVASHSMNVFAPRFLKHRLVLRHAMSRVDIECRDGFADIYEAKTGTLLCRTPAVSLADVGSYPGTLEVVRAYSGDHQALVVLGPTGLVSIRDTTTGEWNSPALVSRFDDLPTLDHVNAMAEASSRTDWSQSFNDGDDRESVYKLQLAQAIALRDMVYLQLAFPGARDAERVRIASTTGKRGLAELWGNGNQLRMLARCSLVFGGSGTTLEQAADELKESPDSLKTLVHEFNQRAQKMLGVDVFEIMGTHVTSAV